MPDDTPAHPYQTSVDIAALAPKVQSTVFPWREPKDLLDAENFVVVVACGSHSSTDHRIQAGAVASAGQDCNSLSGHGRARG